MPAPPLTTLLEDLLEEIGKPQVWTQLLALVAAGLITWLVARWLRARLRLEARRYVAATGDEGRARLREVGPLSDLIWPGLLWLALWAQYFAGRHLHQPVSLVRVAMVLVFSFVLVRLSVHVLRRVFAAHGAVLAFERLIAVLIWSAVALHILGWLPLLLGALDDVVFVIGSAKISLLHVVQALLAVVVTLIVALWAGAALEARLLASESLDPSLRVVLARVGNALLITVAVLVSLSLVGIDLTVLSVFGGALGVGLGLGFQRIASSYVSGFILLLDRSLRIGDLITVDKYHGTVHQIRTRYTVLRALDGTDAIIPNDVLIGQAVLNHSFVEPQVRLALRVVVRLDADVDAALECLVEAARQEEQVLTDPPPGAYLVGMTAAGLELELGFWVADPRRGSLRIRSGLNRRIWTAFRERGILLPVLAPPTPGQPGIAPAAAPAAVPATAATAAGTSGTPGTPG